MSWTQLCGRSFVRGHAGFPKYGITTLKTAVSHLQVGLDLKGSPW